MKYKAIYCICTYEQEYTIYVHMNILKEINFLYIYCAYMAYIIYTNTKILRLY